MSPVYSSAAASSSARLASVRIPCLGPLEPIGSPTQASDGPRVRSRRRPCSRSPRLWIVPRPAASRTRVQRSGPASGRIEHSCASDITPSEKTMKSSLQKSSTNRERSNSLGRRTSSRSVTTLPCDLTTERSCFERYDRCLRKPRDRTTVLVRAEMTPALKRGNPKIGQPSIPNCRSVRHRTPRRRRIDQRPEASGRGRCRAFVTATSFSDVSRFARVQGGRSKGWFRICGQRSRGCVHTIAQSPPVSPRSDRLRVWSPTSCLLACVQALAPMSTTPSRPSCWAEGSTPRTTDSL
jgi:hypothetical protein